MTPTHLKLNSKKMYICNQVSCMLFRVIPLTWFLYFNTVTEFEFIYGCRIPALITAVLLICGGKMFGVIDAAFFYGRAQVIIPGEVIFLFSAMKLQIMK